MVNNEIWKILPKRAQTYDKSFSDIQNLVAAGRMLIMKLADILKSQIAGNQEAKTLFSDVDGTSPISPFSEAQISY